MPWSTSDVDKHIKGLSENQKHAWVDVANQTLEDHPGNEGRAIREANAAAKRAGKHKRHKWGA